MTAGETRIPSLYQPMGQPIKTATVECHWFDEEDKYHSQQIPIDSLAVMTADETDRKNPV